MNFYITYGTVDYLERVVQKNLDQNIRLMANNLTGVLFHETEDKTVFQQPKRYNVLDGSGDIRDGHFAALNHVPVSYEGRPLFEQQFKDQLSQMLNEPGMVAGRVLQPTKGDTYIILTLWESEKYYKDVLGKPKQNNKFKNAYPKQAYSTTFSAYEVDI